MSTLHVHLFGNFQLMLDDQPVPGVKSLRLQSLLAYLLLHCTTPQPRSHLAFVLWADMPETNARNNLRQHLFELRHALPHADQFLIVDSTTVQWRNDAPFTLDVDAFRHALTNAAQQSDVSSRCATLTHAIEMYRGDLLPGCYDEWLVPERERLHQAFIDALETLVELQEHQRDYRAAIATAQRLLQNDPLHESTYRRLMRLYASSGDRASALRTFHTCATILQRELAVEPSAETRTEYARLVKLDTLAPAAATALPVMSPLVGRQNEWTQLQAAWQSAANGQPQMFVLQGEAGIGKTRLAEELLAWAHRQSIANASAHCYSAENAPPFAPIVAWLRALNPASVDEMWLTEIARLLPELAAAHPEWRIAPLTEEWQRQRLLEAIARTLLGAAQPLLLFLDDLQWCDHDSLACLRYLLRFDTQARVLIIGTSRTDEIDAARPLHNFFLALRQSEQLTMLDLCALNESATQLLAANVLGREIEPGLATQLYRETEGSPLFVVEVARAWSSGSHALPPKVQAVIEARLAQISPPARELADIAATIGRDFGFALLAQVSGWSEDVLVRSIDELWRRRIVREQGALAYDFTHDKLREAIVASHSAARARNLHRRVAEALETLYANTLEFASAQIAVHYEHAQSRNKAIHYFALAADHARATFSNADAIAFYRTAIDQIHRTADEPGALNRWRGLAAHLHESLGEVLALTGQNEQARAILQDTLTLVDDPLAAARLHRRIGMSWDSQRLLKEALTEYDLAERALGADQDTLDWKHEWLELQNARMLTGYWLGDFQTMQTIAEKTQPVLDQYGMPLQRARFYRNLVATAFRRDRYLVSNETLAYADKALAASEESGNQSEICFCTFMFGYAYMWRREWDLAEQYLQATLKLADRIQDAERRVLSLTYLTTVYRTQHDLVRFEEYLARARQAATESKMALYVAIADMQETWLIWRRGDWNAAQAKGYAALSDARKLPVPLPLEWYARMPLLTIHLAQGQIDQAIAQAQTMLAPPSGRLALNLEQALQASLDAWQATDVPNTCTHLERAVQLAEANGYL